MPDFDPALLDAPIEGVDPEAEYSISSDPPPGNVPLTVRFSLSGDKGIEVKSKDGKTYVSFRYCGTVTEGEFEGRRFYGYANSLPRPFANNSAWTHVFLRQCGYGANLKEIKTIGQLKELLEQAFNEGHAIPNITLSWSATYVPTSKDEDNNTKYHYQDKVVIYKRWAQFPWADDADHSKGKQNAFTWTNPKTGEDHDITADINILQFGGKD